MATNVDNKERFDNQPPEVRMRAEEVGHLRRFTREAVEALEAFDAAKHNPVAANTFFQPGAAPYPLASVNAGTASVRAEVITENQPTIDPALSTSSPFDASAAIAPETPLYGPMKPLDVQTVRAQLNNIYGSN